jgi:hypothetical protein
MASHLRRLASIDETSLKTNMVKMTGWAPRGVRLVDHAHFGHWRTQTFIAAIRHDRLDAPWVINGAMTGEIFDFYVETQLALACTRETLSFSTTCPATKAQKPRK